MALNVNRWLKYAKARIDSAVDSGHESLDRLESKQEAERADKPWLASDSTAPTFDEARARIAWEADQQAKKADRHRDGKTAEAKGSSVDETRAKTYGSSADETGEAEKTGVDQSDADQPSTSRSRARKEADTPDNDPTPPSDGTADIGPAPRSPQQIAEDAERETARLELEDRQQQSVERLAEIRRELGIDGPPSP